MIWPDRAGRPTIGGGLTGSALAMMIVLDRNQSACHI
jgi:hypothetical protein